MQRNLLMGLGFVAATALSSTASASALIEGALDLLVDGGNNFTWQKVELPGTTCGNGSQYKFFVRNTGSQNVLFFMEGGGACWDYDSCSGRLGMLGAANPNGLGDDYMTTFTAKYVSPLVNGADPGLPGRSRTDLPTKDWNIVYLPYCTGDVHVGDKTVTYTDPTGVEPPLVWHHNGYDNTIAAANYAKSLFPNTQKLLVTGFSAGGTATAAGYYFIRKIIAPKNKGYYLNDSGPIYLAPNANSNSRPLHNKIRQSWALDGVFATLPSTFNPNNMGSINDMVAKAYPNDQLAYTAYTRDYNYSRYSYERFYTPNDQEAVLVRWKQDQDALVNQLKTNTNFSYFIPHHREINDSHCSTIITFIGSHACKDMKKKTGLEIFEMPWNQGYKCPSEMVSMTTFLQRFINENKVVRIYEPENWYNNDDAGMSIVGPLINGALGG
ncbi:pectin acetylesterase-family hydrolase [Chondromyces apiculatus]|uniref:Pectinacetylesterase n=1 Tax=Chondromyces apiculatus DSM 436 TaxID=1192034 RepID=A0A017T4C8_9BACT|nr:pectin acetylesterase-family hydrolase [Chondromyces apiculatus]EYF03867.1 Hypothetical protein CAP_5131 [Chondromyces apiculatus DSM 436]